MDKIRALRYFKRVSELSSFSLAAEEFGVPPSSISRRVKDLEYELGVELVKRSTRNVATTELGSIYYESIVEVLKKLDEADELISQRYGEMEGKLRISATTAYGEKVLWPVLQQFRQQYPSIVLDVQYSDNPISFTKENFDIAIRAGHIPEERVVAKHLTSSSFKLIGKPDLVARLQQQFGRDILSVNDLEQCPTLQYRAPKGLLSWWVCDNEMWVEVNVQPVLTSNSGEALISSALAGDGLALYPAWWAQQYLATNELIEVPITTPISSLKSNQLDIFVLYPQAKYQIPKVKNCVDFIVANLKD
ncbi:LysR family transcriptional regulator [Vibrio tubiashii]|uniref:LysR family transcriptional regulator n=1 Tax=Vibrio tubiashii ATCC 19109 TaxID=1051646 RepID=F9T9H3_9VIBR|nr:LysR family transcriptional regulator [Vibrio tubiashii]AIW15602.1 LysR family transcriptional regulator [Vibrio tubiashii ATCC 19109]EGU51621.1 transcriptional regulator, LysR family protein [Vibrio tubiashii ATCC 19109]EIF02575.1 LysR family transcriptional regulator [Vibrio tubiashii NCIMB 1337 = ATCC 19106]